MQALIWRDNKFVKLLATFYVASGMETVRRWVRQWGHYINIKARLLLKKYQKHMGYVDRLDRFMASAGIRLRRCKRRYHRAIFFWMLSEMLNNIFVLFAILFPLAEALKREHEDSSIGFRHWFQDKIGNVLITYGLKHASQEKILRARNNIARCFLRYLAKPRHTSIGATETQTREMYGPLLFKIQYCVYV